MKRIFAFILAAMTVMAVSLPALAAGEGFVNMRCTERYSNALFSDVPRDAWFRDSVAAVYELGLMRGTGEGVFGPEKTVSIAEAVTLAARLHSLYHGSGLALRRPGEGEEWFYPAIEYAMNSGILDGVPPDCSVAATRRELTVVLGRALPKEALPQINDVPDNVLPDVKQRQPYAEDIYRLYRAGVLTGNGDRGLFAPEQPIDRASAAAIAARMAYRSLRQKFTLPQRTWPDLKPLPAADASFFADTAMLGNSLVEGLQYYSDLKVAYFGKTGANVFENRLEEMLNYSFGKVYLEFGVNELGYSIDAVIKQYGEIVDRIQERLPDADIYIMTLTPVTEKKDAEGLFTRDSTENFNAALYRLCQEKHCWYLDCYSLLLGEDGWLPSEYAGWDGSPHLSEKGYMVWADIIRSYYT